MMGNMRNPVKETEQGQAPLPSKDNLGFYFGISLPGRLSLRIGALRVHLVLCLIRVSRLRRI